MKRLMIFTIVVLYVAGSAIVASETKLPVKDKEVSSEATKDYLTLKVSLAKDTYIEREPIIATFTLVNNSETEQKLAEPNQFYFIGYRITQISGEAPMPISLVPSMIAPPKDCGWVFGPGESKTTQVNLMSLYPTHFPVGRYAVQAYYTVSEYAEIEGVWCGKIQAPSIEFSVVRATGVEIEASKLFISAIRAKSNSSRMTVQELRELAATLRKLSDPKYGGRFAQYAGYLEAQVVYCIDAKEGIERLQSYISEYPDAPYYGLNARRLLGEWLRSDNQFLKARTVFMSLPEGYWRENEIRYCAKLMQLGIVATPVIYPAGGKYFLPQCVTIDCTTEGATIKYTTDGKDPNVSGKEYKDAIPVTSGMIIKARAFKKNWNTSDVAIAEYVIE